jgi:DNA-directed RNA polymerase beta subunit
MRVRQVIETEEGEVTFEGTLTGKELEAVVAVGLNYLLKVGAMLVDSIEHPLT